jgi:hypothetical protein
MYRPDKIGFVAFGQHGYTGTGCGRRAVAFSCLHYWRHHRQGNCSAAGRQHRKESVMRGSCNGCYRTTHVGRKSEEYTGAEDRDYLDE